MLPVPGLLQQIKNALFKNYHLQKSQISLEKFKKYKNILTSCLRQAEKNYYSNKFNEKKSRITSMWATLNSILNPKKNKSPTAISSIYGENKTKLKQDVEIANSLNQFFCSIGKKVGQNVKPTSTSFDSFLKNP